MSAAHPVPESRRAILRVDNGGPGERDGHTGITVKTGATGILDRDHDEVISVSPVSSAGPVLMPFSVSSAVSVSGGNGGHIF